MNEKPMSEVFDERAYYEAEIRPLVEAIYDKCKDRNLPLLIAACIHNEAIPGGDGVETTIAGSVFFNGPGRTPPRLAMGKVALDDGIAAAVEWGQRAQGYVGEKRIDVQVQDRTIN